MGARQRDPAWVEVATRVHGLAMWLYPASFRREFGPWLRQAFRDRCREVARGEQRLFRVLVLELAPDLVTSLGREQMEASFGEMRPRQFLLLGGLCVACLALLFRDAMTPTLLNTVVSLQTRAKLYLEERAISAQDDAVRATAAQLADASSPREQAVAAYLLEAMATTNVSYYSGSRYAWPRKRDSDDARRAGALAHEVLVRSDDPAALAIALEACHAEAGCDRGPLAARLAAVDPDNGYAWAAAFQVANAAGDRDAMRAALARAAASSRFQNYEGTVAATALAEAPVATRIAMAQQLMQARNLPLDGYGTDIRVFCRGVARPGSRADVDAMAAEFPEVRDQCLRVYSLMSGATNWYVALSGNRGVLAMSADGKQRDEARRQMRDLYWLRDMRAVAGGSYMPNQAAIAAGDDWQSWVAAFSRGEGEIPSLRRWFAARGLPVTAPADYVSPNF